MDKPICKCKWTFLSFIYQIPLERKHFDRPGEKTLGPYQFSNQTPTKKFFLPILSKNFPSILFHLQTNTPWETERERERPDKVLTPLKQVLRKVVPWPGCSNCGSWFWLSTPSAFRCSIFFCPLYKVLVHLKRETDKAFWIICPFYLIIETIVDYTIGFWKVIVKILSQEKKVIVKMSR